MRLHEVHPALVHVPLGLYPAAALVEAWAVATGRGELDRLGRTLTPVATAGTAVAAFAGLAAQPAVKVEGRSHDLLVTHRNLNLMLVLASGALVLWRRRRARPGPAYAAAVLSVAGVLTYSASLGGRMVYGHGVGSAAGASVDQRKSPLLEAAAVSRILGTAAANIGQALAHAAKHMAKGEILPLLRRRSPQGGRTERNGSSARPTAANGRPADLDA